MTLIHTLSRYRILVAILTAIAMMVAVAPMAFATDPFGINEASIDKLGNTELIGTITGIINVALGLLGIIAVVIILYAGFQWMTAGGNEEKVTEARTRIIQGVIGLAIIMSAYAIASYVITQLASATDAAT